MRAFLSMLAVSAMFVGCDSKQTWSRSESPLKSIRSDYDAALADATNAIPCAVDFARLFPGLRNTFSYYSGGTGPSFLNMERLLFERYQLTLRIPVTFGASRRNVRSFGEPEFLMQEISEVRKIRKVGSLGPVENVSVQYNPDHLLRFGAGEWKNVVKARGDFSVIGFTVITNSPAPGFDDLQKDWEMRMKK